MLSASADERFAANDDSFAHSISADGRFVAFESDADNLSAADDNGVTNMRQRCATMAFPG